MVPAGTKIVHKDYGRGWVISDRHGDCISDELMVKFDVAWLPVLSSGRWAHTEPNNSKVNIVYRSDCEIV